MEKEDNVQHRNALPISPLAAAAADEEIIHLPVPLVCQCYYLVAALCAVVVADARKLRRLLPQLPETHHE